MVHMDQWTWPKRPTNASEYNEMMLSLDIHLAKQGLVPAQRSLQASRLVSMALKLGGIPFLGHNIQRGKPFSVTDLGPRVFDWYNETYGELNKIDWSPGSGVLELRATYWRLKMPFIQGASKVFIDKDLTKGQTGNVLQRGPTSCNVLHHFVGMTPAFASSLAPAELTRALEGFMRVYHATGWLTQVAGSGLFEQAVGDYNHSVDALMDGAALGKARWDTSQCAEKTFKGLLDRVGQTFPKDPKLGHNISHLGGMVQTHFSYTFSPTDLATIQCPPAVRYGEKTTSRQEAYNAHQALISVLLVLAKEAPIVVP